MHDKAVNFTIIDNYNTKINGVSLSKDENSEVNKYDLLSGQSERNRLFKERKIIKSWLQLRLDIFT